jgi:hypothetical protein
MIKNENLVTMLYLNNSYTVKYRTFIFRHALSNEAENVAVILMKEIKQC